METTQIIHWLYDKAARAQDLSYARVLNMTAKLIRELDEKQRWIPVSERLPDNCKEYLCLCNIDGNTEYPFFMVLRYYLVDKKPHFQHETEHGLNVTHWIPIPELPKENNNEM